MSKPFQKAISVLILTTLFLTFTLTDALFSADMFLCDSIYKKLERQTRDIKIIAIDEKTEAAYGKFEIWSREKAAELIQLLSDDKEKAPSVLVLDIMFIGSGDSAVDARLATAARKAGNVICASNLVYTGAMEENGAGELVYNPSAIQREEKPFQDLAEAVSSGFANNCISKDSIVRYTQLHANVGGEIRHSLAYTTYLAYAGKNGLPIEEPETQDGLTGFFYSGNPGDIPHVSLVDVLDGTVPASEFDDCLVLVGAYAPGMQDAYNPAVSRGEQMYGVEINANIVLALMNDKLANPVQTAAYAVTATAILAIWIFFLEKKKLWVIMTESAVLIGAHLALGRFLALSGYLIPQVYFLSAVVLADIWFIIQKYFIEKARHLRAIRTLKKYVAPQIVEKLSKDDTFELRLGGEKKHIAVLFCDVRGFTTMSESLPPEEVVHIINQYLSVTTKAVFTNEGTLDKFIGDATMAVFNAPFDLDDYVFKAVKTAWDIQAGVATLAGTIGRPIHVGIGINCGEAVVGNIGCDVRMDYTAIGDTVNTAARLESNAKAGQILISQNAYDMISDRIIVDPIGELTLKGKTKKVSVYHVTGFRDTGGASARE